MATTTLEDLAQAYLEGDLSHDAARAFERNLAARPELAQALARVVALNDLLRSLPPELPPQGLEERIVASLGLLEKAKAPAKAPSATMAQIRAALAGAGWGLRGPALALEPAAAAATQTRLALGRLVGASAAATEAPKAPSKPLWRRAVALAWRKL